MLIRSIHGFSSFFPFLFFLRFANSIVIEMEEKQPVIEEQPISILNQETLNSIEFYIEKMNTYKEKNNKSIRELAKEIEISYSTLSRMLFGKRKRLNDNTKSKLDKWIERQEVVNLL